MRYFSQNDQFMSFETFSVFLNTIKMLLEDNTKFDKSLERVLGSDSTIITNINNSTIEYIEQYLVEHFNDEDKWIEYYIWECMLPKNNHIITINDVDYKATPKTIYDILTKQI